MASTGHTDKRWITLCSQQAYLLENELNWWPWHVGKMRTWSASMVRVLPVDGLHVRRSAFYQWPLVVDWRSAAFHYFSFMTSFLDYIISVLIMPVWLGLYRMDVDDEHRCLHRHSKGPPKETFTSTLINSIVGLVSVYKNKPASSRSTVDPMWSIINTKISSNSGNCLSNLCG